MMHFNRYHAVMVATGALMALPITVTSATQSSVQVSPSPGMTVSAAPFVTPSATDTAQVAATAAPSTAPTTAPTSSPTPTPTPQPSDSPMTSPAPTSTPAPTETPASTSAPTSAPAPVPAPTTAPTSTPEPSPAPTSAPTEQPAPVPPASDTPAPAPTTSAPAPAPAPTQPGTHHTTQPQPAPQPEQPQPAETRPQQPDRGEHRPAPAQPAPRTEGPDRGEHPPAPSQPAPRTEGPAPATPSTAPHTVTPQPTRPAPQTPQPGLQGPFRAEPRPVATEPGRPTAPVSSRPQHVATEGNHTRSSALAPFAIQPPPTDTPRDSKIQTVDFNAALSSYTTGNWQAREPSTVDPLHAQSWVSDFVRDDTAHQTHGESGDITGVLGASGNDYNAGQMRADINRLGEAIVTGKGPLILFTILGAGVIIYVTREFATSGNSNSPHKHHDQ